MAPSINIENKEASEADIELESEYERMMEFNKSDEDYDDDEETSEDSCEEDEEIINQPHFVHNCKNEECIGGDHDTRNELYMQNLYYFKTVNIVINRTFYRFRFRIEHFIIL